MPISVTQCGLARQELGRRGEALADFHRHWFCNPTTAHLLYRGNFWWSSGQYAQALDSYERLLRYRTRL